MTPFYLTMQSYIYTLTPLPPFAHFFILVSYSLFIQNHATYLYTQAVTHQNLLPFLFLVIFMFCSHIVSAQSPAVAPAPSGTNVTAVLEKAGQFTTFIKLLKGTKTSDQINTQFSTSSQGITIFVPTDNAFASLKAGTLNSISEQQKLQLLQYHILPTYYTTSQFQTATNPLHTQAGNSDNGQFPLNVTTSGTQVNISTGVVTAPVSNTIFTDNQLAVYQVDQVLLPEAIFGSPAPAPAPDAPKKKVKGADSPSGGSSSDGSPADASMRLKLQTIKALSFGLAMFTTFLL